VVRLAATGAAIGGIGFFGPPEYGTVELGYGIVASMRGRGAATAAVRAALDIARRHGATAAVATTTVGNVASRRVLEKAGLTGVSRSGQILHFRIALLADPDGDRPEEPEQGPAAPRGAPG
jgi:RimJ/RimL family protein N-acetyltransferase